MLDEFMKGNEIIKKFQGEIKNYYVKVRKKILFKINFGIENISVLDSISLIDVYFKREIRQKNFLYKVSNICFSSDGNILVFMQCICKEFC